MSSPDSFRDVGLLAGGGRPGGLHLPTEATVAVGRAWPRVGGGGGRRQRADATGAGVPAGTAARRGIAGTDVGASAGTRLSGLQELRRRAEQYGGGSVSITDQKGPPPT